MSEPTDVEAASTEPSLREAVEAALRGVRDPDLGVNVLEAGLIETVRIDEGTVTIEASLSEFDPQGREGVMDAMMRAVDGVDGVDRVHIEPGTPTAATAADRTAGVESVERVIAVASAKGGVGKTTVATNLACALAGDAGVHRDGRGVRAVGDATGDSRDGAGHSDDGVGHDTGDAGGVGLFDADIYGPNVPELLGVDEPVYADDEERPVPVPVGDETGPLEVMSVGLLTSGGPLAWRGAMAHDALSELFADTAWSDPDTLVIDLPPGTGDVALTTLQEVPVDGVVVVTTPSPTAIADTRRSLALFEENDVPVLGAVVNMGRFECPTCGDSHDLFPGSDAVETTAQALGVPVLATLPFDPALQNSPTPDAVPEPFAALAEQVRERLETIWSVPEADRENAVDLRGVPPAERRERVSETFGALGSGEEFLLVSDRNPSPVRGFLADLVDGEERTGEDHTDEGATIEPFEVEQRNPETWICRTVRP